MVANVSHEGSERVTMQELNDFFQGEMSESEVQEFAQILSGDVNHTTAPVNQMTKVFHTRELAPV